MTLTKVGRAAAITATAGALVIGGAALAANAATGTPSPGTSTAAPGAEGGKGGPMGGHNHTAVTGDELTKVTAAVKAKDSAVTVTSVQKDEDGSYDVFGTKAGNRIAFEVSKDLKTVTERQGGPGGRGGKGGPMGGHNHTPVTGDELTKVTAAVKAKDSAVTVTSVLKDEDGSYDAFGTKAGNRIGLEVSKDLKTVTERTRPEGGRGPGAPDGQAPAGGTQGSTAAPSSAGA
ncbi:hypothetical protein [Kineosporia sp. A_224]|uniref:hypothetical protein n=1 Tax=Kineosporia sp. A_224 TaxID=1962180 RepID=UPI0018E91C73|nr:hypothetical protein [Kineosporia sp. A_224]